MGMRAVAVVRIVTKQPGGEFHQVGLARTGRAEIAQTPDDRAVWSRPAADLIKKGGAGLGGRAGEVVKILEDDGGPLPRRR